MSTKAERINEANHVLRMVSYYGRRFFYDEKSGRVAYFEMDKGGHIWFWDEYSNKRIYTDYPRSWRHFSHGGGLKDFVKALREYISKDIKINGDYMGEYWGYGDAMAELRKCLKDSPVFVWKENNLEKMIDERVAERILSPESRTNKTLEVTKENKKITQSVIDGLEESITYFNDNPQKHPNVNGHFNAVLDAARAYLQGRTQIASVPDGWKLVPIEPTEDIIDAIVRTPNSKLERETAWLDYKAMLSAAPPVTGSAQGWMPIDLVEIKRDVWHELQKVAPNCNVAWAVNFVLDHLAEKGHLQSQKQAGGE